MTPAAIHPARLRAPCHGSQLLCPFRRFLRLRQIGRVEIARVFTPPLPHTVECRGNDQH